METQHPGVQKKIVKYWFTKPMFYMILASSVLFIFAFLKGNRCLFGWGDSDLFLWNIELLDIKTSGAILMAMLSLIYTRSQFEHGLMPLLDYRCQPVSSSEFNLKGHSSDKESVFQTRLANLGGVATITVATYSLKYNDSESYSNLSFSELKDKLENLDIFIEIDYDIVFFSTGWMLGANENRVVFELNISDPNKKELLRNINLIDVNLEFRSLLNDRYKKTIYCIPRRGIELFKDT